MNSERGMGYIKVAILTIIIAVFVATGIYFVRMQFNKAHIKTIKTNMLLVQWKVKEYEDKLKVEGKEMEYLGAKVSDIKEEDSAIASLVENGIIDSENIDKYYALADSDLEKLALEITNEENAYYIVNYETDEVIITTGCKIKRDKTLYKLSDIEAEDIEFEFSK